MSAKYYGVAETAKCVRKALKATFPATKFTVRSSSYSGGASIDIGWMDGPTTRAVDEVVSIFEGAGFDGSIDLRYNISAWILNGELLGTYSHGTEGSMGTVPAWGLIRPHDDAELVDFGADYIHTERRHSPAFVTRLVQKVAQYYGLEAPAVRTSDYDGSGSVAATTEQDRAAFDKTNRWWNDLVWQASQDRTKFQPVEAW